MTIKIISFCLFLSLALNAQNPTDPEKAIAEIKEGALIVNLIYPIKKIEALEASGQKSEALKLKSEIKNNHEEIIQAFGNHYTFGKVLFIYSYNMDKLMDEDATCLFSPSLNKQSVVPSNYYFVEIGSSKSRDLKGIIVKDRNRTQLSKPFPYYISQWKNLHLKKKTISEMVKELNSRFNSFYSSVRK